MRAISLHQPHASAVDLLAKQNETRGWETPYRGPLLIHAAQRRVVRELKAYRDDPRWQSALAGTSLMECARTDYRACLPFGVLLCVCELVDCQPCESLDMTAIRRPRTRPAKPGLSWTEEDMGVYGPKRFAWKLENVQSLLKPVPWKGCQNFFDVPEWAFVHLLPDLFHTVLERTARTAAAAGLARSASGSTGPDLTQVEFWPAAAGAVL